MKKHIVISLFVSVIIFGCYYDSEELLYPAGPCDMNGITYSATVLPALQSNGCIGCHSGQAPSGNVSLEGYSNVKSAALNGKLYGAISHSAGFSPMPKGGNKINGCTINKIKSWINAGAPNN